MKNNKSYMLYFDKKTQEQLEWLSTLDSRTRSGTVTWLIQQEVSRRARLLPSVPAVCTLPPEDVEPVVRVDRSEQ